MEGYGRMKKAPISAPLVRIEPATPYVRGGSADCGFGAPSSSGGQDEKSRSDT